MPAVTVPASPSGDPTASTGSPTRVVPGLASGNGVSPAEAGTCSTAMSLRRIPAHHLGGQPPAVGGLHDDGAATGPLPRCGRW